MSINKVALVGATGNIGPAILKALLDNDFEVTILTREGSTSTDTLSSHPRQKIAKINLSDVNSITPALHGIQGIVSNMASHALLSQKVLIDAAIAAGVQRFIPSDFGSDLSVAANKTVPFNKPKVEIHEYIESQIKSHPSFSYTSVITGPFFDWSLRAGLFGDLQSHTATLWDNGTTPVSTTTLASVGKAVVGVFRNLSATKNTAIRVADTTLTQAQILDIVKSVDGKTWTTTPGSTEEAYQKGLDEMKKPNPDMAVMIYNQLYRILFSEVHEPGYADRLDNEKVGLPVMTEEQVREVVRGCVA